MPERVKSPTRPWQDTQLDRLFEVGWAGQDAVLDLLSLCPAWDVIGDMPGTHAWDPRVEDTRHKVLSNCNSFNPRQRSLLPA